MKTTSNKYHGHRFPTGVISHGVWLYYRFSLSLRDVEELLAKRGITVTHETIRQWCRKFGPEYVRKLRRRQGRLGDVWHLDEVFVKIGGERQYLWRAVDQVRIPTHEAHLFRRKRPTHSKRRGPPIPTEEAHLFRGMRPTPLVG